MVAADEYLTAFASDRSHMLKEDGSWLAEPPTYPCIQTQGKWQVQNLAALNTNSETSMTARHGIFMEQHNSAGRAADKIQRVRHSIDAGLIPWCGKGSFSQNHLSV